MSRLTWRFTAFDSWFFRESRPFDVIGGSELSSVFPPSPATMAGAVRSAIGDYLGVEWRNYPDNYPELQDRIGDSKSLGQMAIKGIFLSRKNPDSDHWERLYPVPAHLVATYEPPSAELPTSYEKARIKKLHFLQVGKPVRCDLGAKVCLAVAPKDIKDIKALESYWLTQTGLTKVLHRNADLIVKTDKTKDYDLIHSSELFSNEARLGIARNNQSRTVIQGNLYQTQHIRPAESVAIEVDVEGLETSDYPRQGIVRLGGEGRAAAFKVSQDNNSLAKSAYQETGVLGIKLVLLSALHVPQQKTYTPLPDFQPSEEHGKTVWRGKINNIALTLHCAIIGKVLREGGWDLQNHKPRPVRSLIPAGSVFYCTVDNGDIDIKTALSALQAAQLDNENSLDQALGRGLLTAGLWFEHDNFKETHS